MTDLESAEAASKVSPEGQIDWSPLKGGGTNFTTHRLVGISSDRVEFRPTLFARVFGLLFLIPGIICIGIGLYILATANHEGVAWFLLPFGAIFAAAGTFIDRGTTTPIVFDRVKGIYWKGKEPTMKPGLENAARLDDIQGIQLLSGVFRTHSDGQTRTYHSYEINLVLEDGRRLAVVDHGGEDDARKDAAQLAEFLGKPLWDRA